MKKIMITLGLATALLAGCNGDGVSQQTGTQNAVAKSATPNMVAQNASVAQVPGQITSVYGGYKAVFTPTDPQNESIYASIQYGFNGTTATNYSNAENSFLVPHRKYNVTITNVDGTPVPQNLQFRFAQTGSLATISTTSLPIVFAKIMLNNGVLTFNNAPLGTFGYNQNFNFIYSSESGNNTYSAVITPFYAGALNIVDDMGDLIVSTNVGNLINPIFENSYNAPHPLIGGRGNYKFEINYSAGIGLSSSSDQELNLDVLYAEGRYLPIGLLSVFQGYSLEVWSVVLPQYSGFSTTLPLPISFGVYSSDYSNDKRVCSGSLFYTNENNGNITIYSNNFAKNVSDPAPDILSQDQWGSAYCISHGDGKRYDVGTISNYGYNDSTNNMYAVRIDW